MFDDVDDTDLMEGFGNSIEEEPLQEETAPEQHTPEVVINKDADDWITINGTHVEGEVEEGTGNLKGSAGQKISSTSKHNKSNTTNTKVSDPISTELKSRLSTAPKYPAGAYNFNSAEKKYKREFQSWLVKNDPQAKKQMMII